MGIRVTTALLAAAVLIGGCKMLPRIEPPKLGTSNATTLTVTLIVNGQVVGVFPSGEVRARSRLCCRRCPGLSRHAPPPGVC